MFSLYLPPTTERVGFCLSLIYGVLTKPNKKKSSVFLVLVNSASNKVSLRNVFSKHFSTKATAGVHLQRVSPQVPVVKEKLYHNVFTLMGCLPTLTCCAL